MATERKKNKYHIIVELGKWCVVPDGKIRARRICKTEEEAISFAQAIIADNTGEVIVHTNSGDVKHRIYLNNQ